MAKYDNNFTDLLRNRLSIVDIVNHYIPLVKKGQNYWGCCPFHNEKTPSFSVNEDKGFFHCFGCGKHGDIISFVMEYKHLDFLSAITELAEMAGVPLPTVKQKSKAEQEAEESYFAIVKNAQKIFTEKLYTPEGEHALAYIKNRGFTDEMIKKYGIGYAPKNNIISNKFVDIKREKLIATGLVRQGEYGLYDFFRDKLMFPIYNAKGHIVAFSGRSLDGSEPKYINTSDTELFHKRQTLFGFNFAREDIHKNNRTIVVEGQIDTIQMQCNGFGETVAPLGTALTEDHLALLCKANRNIVFCFDGDGAGQKAAVRAAGLIMPFIRDNSEVKFAFVTGGKDPDEILRKGNRSEMEKIINDAIPLVDFLWKTANTNYLVKTPSGRAQAEKYLKQEVNKIQDNLLKTEYERDYKNRKFNEWRNYNNKKDDINIEVPEIDSVVKNTIIFIINKFPELAERYGDFLNKLNLDLDQEGKSDLDFNLNQAERYIYSLKIQKYLEFLEEKKHELIASSLKSGISASEEIQRIEQEIKKLYDKQDILLNN